MLVLGLQGSPRLKGNTRYLLETFLECAESLGARVKMLDVDKMNIIPCKEYITCEKKGFCPIDDDVKHIVYPLLREAEVVVTASPIFFFNMTAQLKALVDRCQMFWARKYRFRLEDPLKQHRAGFLLSVGGSKAKRLFDGLELTVKYFYDAIDAQFKGGLTYKNVENPSDSRNHPTMKKDVEKAVNDLLAPFLNRKKVLFTCPDNACLSQMACAFAQIQGGDRLDVMCGGPDPAEKIDASMEKVMKEINIDMKYRSPKTIQDALSSDSPDMIVTMGGAESAPREFKNARVISWDVMKEADDSLDSARKLRDELSRRVEHFIETL